VAAAKVAAVRAAARVVAVVREDRVAVRVVAVVREVKAAVRVVREVEEAADPVAESDDPKLDEAGARGVPAFVVKGLMIASHLWAAKVASGSRPEACPAVTQP
jgi:hypothetical protein